MTDKEERLLTLLKAHEHLSEYIGYRRKGIAHNNNYSHKQLEGLKEGREQLREVVLDTALMEVK